VEVAISNREASYPESIKELSLPIETKCPGVFVTPDIKFFKFTEVSPT